MKASESVMDVAFIASACSFAVTFMASAAGESELAHAFASASYLIAGIYIGAFIYGRSSEKEVTHG